MRREGSASLPPLAGAGALLTIVLIDRWLGEAPRALLPHGLADEAAHLLTAFLLLAAVPWRSPRRVIAGVLIGAVAIDLDHLPLILGSDLLTRETNRPLTHSFLLVAGVAALAMLAARGWRAFGLGLAAGVAAHLWRDLATSTAGAPLLWPLATHGVRLPYGVYAGSLLACVIISMRRACGRVTWRRGGRRRNAKRAGADRPDLSAQQR